MNSTLGSRVKSTRETRETSQGALARSAGISQAALSRIESGKAAHVEARTVAKLADALGVTTDFLLGRVDESRSAVELFLGMDYLAQPFMQEYVRLSDDRRRQLHDYAVYLLLVEQ